MKRIPNIKPLTVLGKPFRIQDLFSDNANQEDPQLIDANMEDLLKMLVMSIPRAKCTMQDSVNAFDFTQQLRDSQNGNLEFTEGIHDWLKKTVEAHGPAIYGVNVRAIMQALDSFERPHETAKAE